MRRTPPVVVHLQPQLGVQAVVASIAALTVAGLAAWAISHEPRSWPTLLALPLVACWAWREAAVQPRRLRWDGQTWWLAGRDGADEIQVQLAVLIDLDAWLLLRAGPGQRWLPLSRAQQPGWTAFRATLFAARGEAVQR